jgi:hypothetical protein
MNKQNNKPLSVSCAGASAFLAPLLPMILMIEFVVLKKEYEYLKIKLEVKR